MADEEFIDYATVEHEGCYTIRLDNIDADRLKEFFNKYPSDYSKYCISDEVGKSVEEGGSGKQHMQGIIEFGRVLDKKEETKHRNRIASFFDRRGNAYSFKVVQEYQKYMTYILKQHKIVLCVGYSVHEIEYWKKAQQVIEKKIEVDKRKREVKKQQLKPMQMIYEFYEPEFLKEFDKASKLQVNPDYTHTDFLKSKFNLADHVAKHVIIYWGEMAHKCFMLNKIAEAADYVCYRIMRKYSESIFDDHMRVAVMNVRERMSFA